MVHAVCSVALCLFILHNTIKADPATLQVVDIFHTDVYTLLNKSISNVLVDEDANCAWSDIVGDACSAVGSLSI